MGFQRSHGMARGMRKFEECCREKILFENYEFQKHLKKIFFISCWSLRAGNFFHRFFFGHELMRSWMKRFEQKNRKNETLKIFNFTYRLLREKMLFLFGTAAFNWHLKSYTEALEPSRGEFPNKFLLLLSSAACGEKAELFWYSL